MTVLAVRPRGNPLLAWMFGGLLGLAGVAAALRLSLDLPAGLPVRVATLPAGSLQPADEGAPGTWRLTLPARSRLLIRVGLRMPMTAGTLRLNARLRSLGPCCNQPVPYALGTSGDGLVTPRVTPAALGAAPGPPG